MNCFKLFGTKDLYGSGILCKIEEKRQSRVAYAIIFWKIYIYIYIYLLCVSLKIYKLTKDRGASFFIDLYETK